MMFVCIQVTTITKSSSVTVVFTIITVNNNTTKSDETFFGNHAKLLLIPYVFLAIDP